MSGKTHPAAVGAAGPASAEVGISFCPVKSRRLRVFGVPGACATLRNNAEKSKWLENISNRRQTQHVFPARFRSMFPLFALCLVTADKLFALTELEPGLV